MMREPGLREYQLNRNRERDADGKSGDAEYVNDQALSEPSGLPERGARIGQECQPAGNHEERRRARAIEFPARRAARPAENS